jgi:hypothetical protein
LVQITVRFYPGGDPDIIRKREDTPVSPMLIYLYVMASILVGYFGRRRVMGFLGFFLTSLLITPVGGLLVLLLTAPRTRTA